MVAAAQRQAEATEHLTGSIDRRRESLWLGVVVGGIATGLDAVLVAAALVTLTTLLLP